MLNLYCVLYDGQPYYVEAPSFELAIEAWKGYVKVEWKEAYDGTEKPKSVECLDSDHPVIRYADPNDPRDFTEFR